jgi:hypothetical protein
MEALSREQYALQEIGKGESLHKHQGVWWRTAEPFFCMPAWVLESFPPKTSRPCFMKSIGGFVHVVPSDIPANGSIDRFVLDLGGYGIHTIGNARKRTDIRNGLKNVEIRQIDVMREFAGEAHPLYLAWSGGRREQEGGKAFQDLAGSEDLSDAGVFKEWMAKEYDLPKRLTLAAYFEGKPIAFVSGFGVGDTSVCRTIVSDPALGKLHAIDALLYAFAVVSQNSGFKRFINGRRSSRPSLDEFKRRHGFREEVYPCRVWLNPLIEPVLKVFRKEKYRRLLSRKGEEHRE